MHYEVFSYCPLSFYTRPKVDALEKKLVVGFDTRRSDFRVFVPWLVDIAVDFVS